jgi:dephospho-CoA kinase
MLVLGITGGTGAGKSTLLEAIRRRGGVCVDCDLLYYELLAESDTLRRELKGAFGDVFLPDGKLDRAKLGKIVFDDSSRMQALDAIVFRHVSEAMRERLEEANEAGTTLFAIEAINLFESGLSSFCTATVGVLASAQTREARIMARDHITRERAAARIKAQKPDSYYRERCGCILENDGCEEAFAEKTEKFLTFFIKEFTP